LILAFGLFLSYAFFYGPSPINGADNYAYTHIPVDLLHGQLSQFEADEGPAQQFFLISGIALFYGLFGISPLTASMFGVLCFLITILAVYKIGAVLYNKKAGVISAFIYSFNPVAVVNASYVGDDGSMILLISLCVMFLVMGIKEKRKKRRYLYFGLAGFFTLSGIMAEAETIVILAFVIPLLLVYLFKDRKPGAIISAKSLVNTKFFICGLLYFLGFFGLLEMAFGKPPFFLFTANSNLYTNLQVATPQFFTYVAWIFPYHIWSTFTTIINEVITNQTMLSLLITIYNQFAAFFNTSTIQSMSGISNGLFGYFAIASASYLLLRKNTHFFIPGFWSLSTFLYLGLGTVSLTHYVPIGIAYVRMMIVLLPGLALVIGFAVADLLEINKSKFYRYVTLSIVVLLIGLLLTTSFVIIRFVDLSQYVYVYPLEQVGNFLKNLGPNVSVSMYTIFFPIQPYIPYNYGISLIVRPNSQENCTDVTPNSYILIEHPSSSFGNMCNSTEVFGPPYMLPAYLSQYNMFNNNPYGSYTNITVYYHNG
jgi:hypothetical protein